MKAQFNVLATSEDGMIANVNNVARGFFGATAPDVLVVLVQAAYAQENINVPNPQVPVVVNWAATVIAEVVVPAALPQRVADGWTVVP